MSGSDAPERPGWLRGRVAAGGNQPAEDLEVDAATLRAAGVHGVKWSLIQTIGSTVSRLAFTFVLVRLMGPTNFGIIAQATIYISLMHVVMDQGFGAALVQRKVLDERDIGTVTWMNLASGLVLALATVALAPFVADFFHTPELVAVLRVLAISVVIQSFQLVPRALVRRRLLFRSQTVIEMIAVVVSGIIGVLSAVAGADYWALVVQTMVYDVLILIGLSVLTWELRSFRASRRNLRALWAFSAGLMGSSFLVFFGQNFDNLLIGRYQSERQLAYYALSYRLLLLPMQMIGGVANTVSLPIFARLQDDDERLRSWFLRSTSLVSLVAFPALTMLVVGAQEGVPLVFGKAWQPAATPLMVLSVAGAAIVVRMLMSPVAQAKGKTNYVFWWAVATFGSQGVAFYIGVHWGIVGVAVGFAVATFVVWPLNVLHFARRLMSMRMRDYGASLLPATVSSLVMAAAWVAVDRLLGLAGVDVIVRILAATTVALPLYVLTVKVVFPDALAATREVAQLMLRRAT